MYPDECRHGNNEDVCVTCSALRRAEKAEARVAELEARLVEIRKVTADDHLDPLGRIESLASPSASTGEGQKGVVTDATGPTENESRARVSDSADPPGAGCNASRLPSASDQRPSEARVQVFGEFEHGDTHLCWEGTKAEHAALKLPFECPECLTRYESDEELDEMTSDKPAAIGQRTNEACSCTWGEMGEIAAVSPGCLEHDPPPVPGTDYPLSERLSGAVRRAGFRLAPDVHGEATLWCLECKRDSGFHWSTCSRHDSHRPETTLPAEVSRYAFELVALRKVAIAAGAVGDRLRREGARHSDLFDLWTALADLKALQTGSEEPR